MNRQDVKSYLIIKQSRVTDWIIMWYICQFTVSFKCRVYSVKKNTRSLFEAEMESMCFGAGCTKQPEREESATVRTEQIIQTTLTALQPTGTRERGEKSSPASAANVVYQLAGGKKKKKKSGRHLTDATWEHNPSGLKRSSTRRDASEKQEETGIPNDKTATRNEIFCNISVL